VKDKLAAVRILLNMMQPTLSVDRVVGQLGVPLWITSQANRVDGLVSARRLRHYESAQVPVLREAIHHLTTNLLRYIERDVYKWNQVCEQSEGSENQSCLDFDQMIVKADVTDERNPMFHSLPER
jgi:hypothetical protein